MRLSIITINLNNREGLQKTIDSVICQTFKDFEWIIIDGGSTDGSKELIEQYSEHFSYWVSEPDKGIYNAMNKGIMKAQGEYVLHLNSGDRLYNENSINTVISNKLESDIIFFSIIHEEPQFSFVEKSPEIITARFLFHNTLPHSGACLIKKELFQTLGLYDEEFRYASDWAFYLNAIVMHNASVHVHKEILSHYDGTGVSAIHSDEYCNEMNSALSKYLPKIILDDYSFFENSISNYERFFVSSKRLSTLPVKLIVKAFLYKIIRRCHFR